MIDAAKLAEILHNIDLTGFLNDLNIKQGTTNGGDLYLQVEMLGDGTHTWRGRKWGVSFWFTESEVVQTALKAVLTFLEHEAREGFLYKSKAVFNPHIDIDSLLEVADRRTFRQDVVG